VPHLQAGDLRAALVVSGGRRRLVPPCERAQQRCLCRQMRRHGPAQRLGQRRIVWLQPLASV